MRTNKIPEDIQSEHMKGSMRENMGDQVTTSIKVWQMAGWKDGTSFVGQ